ncbi:hypothetical protein HPP92_011698 [Vanilla planifolia]|uniref:Reticulon-like protein n=1 Tax=Vanilla planifolia TaxID=51239 RepID=A0A835R3E0_VANPL|nr:hypothetical protein HPP92_011698 [Vanilla planifolia]
MAESENAPMVVAVTFGRSSFVGRSLVAALLSDGRYIVRVVDPQPAPDPTPSLSPFFKSGRISYHHVDIRYRSPSLPAAITGAATVFHVDPTASALQLRPASSSDFHRFHLLLVQSTRNLISACRECGVQRLVYVGSADVLVGGESEVFCFDESVAYPEKYVDGLNELRAQTEAIVLGSNRMNGLLTCALRVSNPFGPSDDKLVPTLVKGAKEGWTKFIVGSGENLWDFTYIANVVHASIFAERALRLRTPYVDGRPFFITNKEPVKFWSFLSSILEGLGYPRPSIRLPAKLVFALAEIARLFQEKLHLPRASNPIVASSTIRSFSMTRTFDSSNAERILGYSPVVSLEDGITLTIASFSQLANNSPMYQRDLTKSSKAEKLLGDGKVASILLWRDDRRTFALLLALFLLHYWFFLSKRTFVSSAANLIIYFALVLFIHGLLPSSLLGLHVERIPLSSFEVSEITLRKASSEMASLWNFSIHTLDKVAQGEDWGILLKVIGFLYFIKLCLLFSLKAVSAVGLVGLFTSFIIYEQFEGEIETIIATAGCGFDKIKEFLITHSPSYMVKYVL